MFTTGTDAFLTIRCSFQIYEGCIWWYLIEEYGFVLVHTGVGEEEGCVTRWGYAFGGFVEGVGLFIYEVIYELGSYFVHTPFCICTK